MSRISQDALLRAIAVVQKMNSAQKIQLADEIFVSQPNMLGSFLVLPTLGVPTTKTGLAFDTLLLCFQAMKESGLTWPVITEDDMERQSARTTAILSSKIPFLTRISERTQPNNISMTTRRKNCMPGS